MQHRKNVTPQLLLLVHALALLAACVPPFTSLVSPTPTCTGGWGPYIGKDIPGWTSAWKAAFGETDLEAKDVKVQGVGETWVSICNGKTTESWGMAYAEIQATIIVDDVKNFDSLGSTMAKVYRAVKTLTTNEKDLSEVRLLILFVSRKDENEVMSRNCNYHQGITMIEQGKSGKELIEATCGK